MTKLIVSFLNFANAPKNRQHLLSRTSPIRISAEILTSMTFPLFVRHTFIKTGHYCFLLHIVAVAVQSSYDVIRYYAYITSAVYETCVIDRQTRNSKEKEEPTDDTSKAVYSLLAYLFHPLVLSSTLMMHGHMNLKE